MDLTEKLKKTERAYLLLADGTEFQGYSLGARGTTIGEVVFTTGMTGYQESLTDPSFYGQIVTQTFPLIGNYGTNEFDVESSLVWMKGYIVRDWCEAPSNFRSELNISQYLKDRGVVGLWGIDTRALTRKLREYGVMNGAITTEYPINSTAKARLMDRIRAFGITDAVAAVTCKNRVAYNVDDPCCNVVLLDYGFKRNILRSLNKRGCNVMVAPATTTLGEIREMGADGVMLSNGPGDPAESRELIDNVAEIMNESDLPLLGICLGHQIAALAMGGSTAKLKYGHRGANQPVMDTVRDRVFITSQNHGYAVLNESITEKIGRVSHYNVNDGSCEGIIYNRPDTFTVQFHPEASAGPRDTQYLFDRFVDNMIRYKEGR